ncbi:hypothetical protein [Pseudarthrobacter sp. PvP090]|uniref:hypothetical protein n=1 Tax=Pseudarthrobacter sp. PvP090 TaxID=3156393 RepID=UPI00339B0B15
MGSSSLVDEKLIRSPFLWLAVGVFAFQRFGLQIGDGSLPVITLALLWTAAAMVTSGRMLIHPGRLAILLCVVVIGALGLLMHPVGTSVASLALVFVTWLPAALMTTERGGGLAVPEVDGSGLRSTVATGRSGMPFDARAFVVGSFWTVVVASCFAVFQFVVSYGFSVLIDPLAAIPQWITLPGFNSTYPVEFGGSWYRANGGIFLEASFLSLFAVFGLVLCWSSILELRPRTRLAVSAILLVALVGSVATSGLVLMPLLLLAMLRTPQGQRALLVMAGILVLGAASSQPILSFVGKALQNPFDTSGQVSVASRVYRPYLDLLDIISSSPIVGTGPGSSRSYVEGLDVGVTTPTLMKVAVDYGLLGLFLFVLLWWSLYRKSSLPVVVKLALLVALIVPTDGLTSSVLVPLYTWMLLLTMETRPAARALSAGMVIHGKRSSTTTPRRSLSR